MMLEEHRKRLGFMERYEADAGAAMDGLRSHFDVLLAAIAAGRAELIRIHRAGLIEDEVLHELERDLDVEESKHGARRCDRRGVQWLENAGWLGRQDSNLRMAASKAV